MEGGASRTSVTSRLWMGPPPPDAGADGAAQRCTTAPVPNRACATA
jgi:hypothetical protein